jgi:flagellar biosynthetic protein FlhB
VVALGLDLLRHMMIPLGFLGCHHDRHHAGHPVRRHSHGRQPEEADARYSHGLNPLPPGLKRVAEAEPAGPAPGIAIMIPAFGAAIYYLVADNFQSYLSLPLRSVPDGASLVAGSIQTLLWKASFVFIVFGSVDLLRQKRRYQNDLKMSKQDIRDEFKEVEGNPLMKQRIRRIRRDMARRRMMHEVPTATAVIVNPTHYAVALKYSMDAKGAPMVVAKGKNYLALRIRQKAVENQVPLIENPPLAQALYKSVDVGQEIPAQFYRAVAEVLAYIFKLMNGRRNA